MSTSNQFPIYPVLSAGQFYISNILLKTNTPVNNLLSH